MRLGKTLETLAALYNIGHHDTLVVCPKIATGVWQFEAKQWFDWSGLCITGKYKPAERRAMRENWTEDLLIINPAMLKETLEWKSKWSTIVVDETHLCGLLNHKSKTLSIIKKAQSENLFLLTGTPIRKGPDDLWPMLHLLDPRKFPAYWPFVNKYCHVIKTPFGKEILNRPKNPTEFNKMLKHYMIRHKKSEVLKDLPDKVRRVLPIDMNKQQARMYNELFEDMMTEVGDDILMVPSVLTKNLRLRQLLVCPRILGVDDDGAALTALVKDLIPQEFDDGRAVVVGTPFRTAIPYIIDAIRRELPDTYVETIHGEIKETAQQVAQRFQNYADHRKVLVYTLKTGASWTAHTASTGFALGYEWSTTDMVQAEDRIHRMGQKLDVIWNYLLHPDTIDELIMETLNVKSSAEHWILRPQEMYKKLEQLKNCPRNRTKSKV